MNRLEIGDLILNNNIFNLNDTIEFELPYTTNILNRKVYATISVENPIENIKKSVTLSDLNNDGVLEGTMFINNYLPEGLWVISELELINNGRTLLTENFVKEINIVNNLDDIVYSYSATLESYKIYSEIIDEYESFILRVDFMDYFKILDSNGFNLTIENDMNSSIFSNIYENYIFQAINLYNIDLPTFDEKRIGVTFFDDKAVVDTSGVSTLYFATIIPDGNSYRILNYVTPRVYGVRNNATYNEPVIIKYYEGTGTLNGQAFTSGTSVSAAGKYTLFVKDEAGNVTTVNFEIADPNPSTPSTPTDPNPSTPSIPTDPNPSTPSTPTEPSPITQTTVTNPNNSTGTNNQSSQPNYVEKLNDLTEILSDENVSNQVFANLLKDIFNLNPDFISELDEAEQEALEDKIQEVYASTLDIRVEGNSELKLEGYSFIDDLAEILKGSKIEVLVQVSEEINSTDQSLIDSYVSKNNLDSTMLYSIDLELFKSINGVEEKLSTLKQPVTITLPLPSKFAGVTDFTIIHVHEGTIYELPVIINGDGTFSFTTDKFSSFTLIDAAKLVPVIEEVEQSKNELNWLWGGSLIIIVAMAAYFICKKIKQVV